MRTVCLLAAWALAPGWAAPPAAIELPAPALEGGLTLRQALRERKSHRAYSPKKLPRQMLSNVLWAAYGVNRPAEGGRTAPSAHNWQVIDVYVALEEGLFLYDARGHRLVLVNAADVRDLTSTQEFTHDAPLNLVYVARMEKMTASPEDSQEDLLAWASMEAGAVSQNVSLACAAERLATVVRAGVQRPAFAKAARLAPTHRILLAQTIGYPR